MYFGTWCFAPVTYTAAHCYAQCSVMLRYCCATVTYVLRNCSVMTTQCHLGASVSEFVTFTWVTFCFRVMVGGWGFDLDYKRRPPVSYVIISHSGPATPTPPCSAILLKAFSHTSGKNRHLLSSILCVKHFSYLPMKAMHECNETISFN